jgi:hypothetical protein
VEGRTGSGALYRAGIGRPRLGAGVSRLGRPREEWKAVTKAEADAQAELRGIVEELDAISTRLRDVHARLSVPPQETAMLAGEQEIDVASEMSSVIECVLDDSLRPAIRDLAAAASSRPQGQRS